MTSTRRIIGVALAIILALASFGALKGAFFGRNFVQDQLAEQNITFGAYESPRDKAWYDENPSAKAFAGKEVTNGWAARQFADYINHHATTSMETYNKKYGTSIKTYSEASDESRKPEVTSGDPARATEATNLRRTTLDAQLLRGTLLNTYGWWWVGTIALWAGWILAILAVLSLIWALLPKRGGGSTTTTSQS